jgi:hypothetical protein
VQNATRVKHTLALATILKRQPNLQDPETPLQDPENSLYLLPYRLDPTLQVPVDLVEGGRVGTLQRRPPLVAAVNLRSSTV